MEAKGLEVFPAEVVRVDRERERVWVIQSVARARHGQQEMPREDTDAELGEVTRRNDLDAPWPETSCSSARS